jgi:hypothetical protein
VSKLAALVVASLFLARPAAAGAPTPLVLDQQLAEVLADRAAVLAKKRRPLRFDSGTEVDSCTTYAAARCSSTLQESESNEAAVDDYVVCDQLALLQTTRAARQAGPKNRGDVLSRRLDLRTFRSSLKQRLDERTFVLQTLWRPAPRVDARQAVGQSADWKFVLAVDAVIDVDGDGREDWLVSVTDRSLEASYDSRQLLIVRAPGTPGLLRAEPVDKWVCPTAH